jgi:hypothetical protein
VASIERILPLYLSAAYIAEPEKARLVLVLPQRGQLLTRRNLSVLGIYDLISKREPDDVRWETVKQFKLILAKGAYPAPPERVAVRLIETMLERGRCLFPQQEEQVKYPGRRRGKLKPTI